jgi:hypothetical protein
MSYYNNPLTAIMDMVEQGEDVMDVAQFLRLNGRSGTSLGAGKEAGVGLSRRFYAPDHVSI